MGADRELGEQVAPGWRCVMWAGFGDGRFTVTSTSTRLHRDLHQYSEYRSAGDATEDASR